MKTSKIIDAVINHVEHSTGIQRVDIVGKSRAREISDARRMVIWLTRRAFPRVTYAALAAALNMTTSNIGHSYVSTQDLLTAYPGMRQEWETTLENLRHGVI